MVNEVTSSDLDLALDDTGSADPVKETKESVVDTRPDKYKGKTVEDIIAMHMNAERKIADQGNEIGAYRKTIMQPAPTVDKTKERVPVTVDSLVNDPDKAILDAVNHSPVADRLEKQAQQLETLERDVAYRTFASQNPAWQSDITDQEFIGWVSKNPVRVHLATLADNRDFNAATNLWGLWQEHKEIVSATNTKKKEQKLVEARTTRTGATETPGDTIYSAAKLMALRHRAYSGEDRAAAERLNEIQPDLIQAYKEGRVR